MKYLALILFVSPVATLAVGYNNPSDQKVQYQSWCEGDQVMTEDKYGQVVTQFDCYTAGDSVSCAETAVKKGEWIIISATCK